MTRLDEMRMKALRGQVEWHDIDYLLSVAEASVALLNELEAEAGYWSNETKEKALLNQPAGEIDSDDLRYYNAIRRLIDLTGWTLKQSEEEDR